MKDLEKRRRSQGRWRDKNRESLRAYDKIRRRKFKTKALERYGLQCCLCGFSDIRALQIDHIDNNGAEERKMLGGQHVAGWSFYRWLHKQGWPDGYQTLCANCNLIKHRGEDF